MFKRWFCLLLVFMISVASFSFGEADLGNGESVSLEGLENDPIIDELPGDLDMTSIGDIELSLSDLSDGSLDGTQPGAEDAQAVVGAIVIENAETDDDGNETTPRLTLSADRLTIGVKEKCTILEATRVPRDDDDTVTWSSDKTSVAKVNKNTGAITGVKKGTATITAATASGLKASCKVTVRKAPDKVTLTPSELTLSVGETCGLKAKLPSNTGSTLTWSSKDKGIAAVDQLTGVVTAVAPGSTTITVKTFNKKKAVCKLTVVAEPAEVFLPEALTVAVNEKTTIEATAVDANGGQVPATFTYRAKKGTGSVSINAKTGKIMGKSVGTAKIYVSAQNGVSTHLVDGKAKKTVCLVNVVEVPDRIELAANAITVGVGQTFDLMPRALAADGSELEYGAYTVKCSSESGLSVTDKGVVKGLSIGKYTVSFTAINGVQASCDVTVVKAPYRVTLSPDEVSLVAGTGAKLNVTLPVGSMASYTFTSSAPQVATVDGEGNVAAVAPGTAVIRVQTHNSKWDECTVTVVEAASGLIVSPASVSAQLKEGGVQLRWQLIPDGDGVVTFGSEDPAVATVDEAGYVRFVAVGATRITATADNGQTATVEVTVLADEAENEPAYRLFAAYSYYDSLPFVKRNADSMAKVFRKSNIDGGSYTAWVLGNPSKARIVGGISAFFADADENDVSIVYLCSHGHNDKSSYTDYRMSLKGYDSNKNNPKYYLTSDEIFDSVQGISGNVVLILDSCYSGTFINDMKSRLKAENGRIAVLTAASNTRATYYNNKSKAVDFFTFFLLMGLGYNEKEDWWNGNSEGDKGSYPGYFAADKRGNGDGAATLGEFYSFASNSIDANIPGYMTKSWYWGDRETVQKTRIFEGNLKNLIIYQPE